MSPRRNISAPRHALKNFRPLVKFAFRLEFFLQVAARLERKLLINRLALLQVKFIERVFVVRQGFRNLLRRGRLIVFRQQIARQRELYQRQKATLNRKSFRLLIAVPRAEYPGVYGVLVANGNQFLVPIRLERFRTRNLHAARLPRR